MAGTILIVEDEADIRQMLGFALTRAGYPYREAADAEAAEVYIREEPPDLILLDWMLPGMSGVDFARRLKRDPTSREIPIIMLTARTEESDKVRGLEVGADDYVTKPFSPRELLARIKAVLRRTAPERAQQVIEVEGLKVDPQTHRVTVEDAPVALSPMEFRLLHFFVNHPERVYSRNQLLDQVWGGNVYVEERTVDVHIRRLRKALAPHGLDKYIQTVRSVGYRFSTQPKF
ncbi:MAG: phosphate regulon transcriptional regulator PhoB [Gammaproteobacteria bacterium]|nr:phosphate regulon transcriptional regulator PhoB [Gammaproteobacteria bacterium]MCI0591451.1 phosphate regulon transcriptional regulator PhoB [Gammaproteobacteria bacterium]